MASNQTLVIMLLIVCTMICNTHQMPANDKHTCLGMCQHNFQQCLINSPNLGDITNCRNKEKTCTQSCERTKTRSRRSVRCNNTCVAVIATCFKASTDVRACIKTVHPTCLERCHF
uniref:Cnidarian restricted protein n=1 Tax=Clytia hemisphaerica TaxID=252671 RepID=A0A7M5WM14_9CNID|eukprot:TCONS_00001061-protein